MTDSNYSSPKTLSLPLWMQSKEKGKRTMFIQAFILSSNGAGFHILNCQFLLKVGLHHIGMVFTLQPVGQRIHRLGFTMD